jgi:hypothetical protein
LITAILGHPDSTRNTGYPYHAPRIMLQSTASVLQQGGRDVTCDPARMNVYLLDQRGFLSTSGGHCESGIREPATVWYLAEGTTREGFDEWLCLQNPLIGWPISISLS